MNFRNLNGKNRKEYPVFSAIDAVCEITSDFRVVYFEFSNGDIVPLILENVFNEGFMHFGLAPSMVFDTEIQMER